MSCSTTSRWSRFTVGMALCIALISTTSPVSAEDWNPSQIQETEVPLVWSRAATTDRVALDRTGRRNPMNPGQLTFFLACERDTQLDCIESLSLVESSGSVRKGSFVGATTEMSQLPGVGELAFHSTFWEIPELLVNGETATIRLDGTMGSNAAAPGLNGMKMDMEIVPKRDRPEGSPDDLFGCIPGPNPDDYCVAAVALSETTRLQLVFRTSWISPAIVRARMRDADLNLQDLGNGALRWTLTGNAMLGQSFTLNTDGKERPAWVSTSFDFYVWDPRMFTGLDERCYRNGPLLYSFNGQLGGQPNWNPRTGTLELNVDSLHYWPDGQTVWRGYYQTSIGEATARCLWGIDPKLTSSVRLEVFDEDGNTKAATTTVGFRGGKVVIAGYDFTYSTSRLVVQVRAKAGSRCVSAKVQLRDLVCTAVGKKLVWSKRRR